MPGMSGLEVAQQASGRCHVVFVTAYDEYAVAAFEQGAVDYVMKPFSTARLAKTVARLKERLGTRARRPRRHPAHARRTARARRKDTCAGSPLRRATNCDLITVDEICYFRADHKYTMVVTATAESLIR